MAKTIGSVLRARREAAGIPQATLARKLRISAQVLSRIESGERADPRFSTVARIAALLGTSLDEIATLAGLPSAAAPRMAKMPEALRQDAALDKLDRHLDRAKAIAAALRRTR